MSQKLFSNTSLKIVIWNENDTVENFGVVEADRNTIPSLLLYEKFEILFLKLLLWTNLLVGGGYRILIFRLIKKKGGLGKPINIMIAADEFIKVLGYTTWIQFLLLAVNSKEPLVRSMGTNFCNASQYLTTYGSTHGIVGGAGIAFVRLFYIRFPSIMAGCDKALAISTTLASLVFSGIITLIYFNLPKKGINILDSCIGYSDELSIIKFHYENWNTPYNFHRQIVILTLFLMLLVEIGCYIAIFRLLSIHDKSMSTLLPKEKIRKRIQKNAVDLTGHVNYFIVETGCLVLWALISHFLQEGLHLLVRSFYVSSYGVTAVVNILLSNVLQNEVLDILRELLQVPFKICSFKL